MLGLRESRIYAAGESNETTDQLVLRTASLRAGTPYALRYHESALTHTLAVDYAQHAQLRAQQRREMVALRAGARTDVESRGFGGCLRALRVNGELIDMAALVREAALHANGSGEANGTRAVGVRLGCPHVATCASLRARFCAAGRVCRDSWKGPLCSCKSGAGRRRVEKKRCGRAATRTRRVALCFASGSSLNWALTAVRLAVGCQCGALPL